LILDAIEVRRALRKDAEVVSAVLLSAFLEFQTQYTKQGFAATTPNPGDVIQRIAEGPIWLVVRNSEPVGTASVVVKQSGLYIRGMAVLPSARGLGVAALLFEKIDEFSVEHNCERQFLSTTPFLSSAIRFYERCGFVRIPDGPHDLYGTPLFTMEKRLGARC
jgi:GNAT superfamily N-acetyltransferase